MNAIRWDQQWRESVLAGLEQEWDLLIIGSGITGAGIFRSAVSAGLKTLLVEANDFAFGTSSRSSKLVHGGFRYLYNRQYHVTYESVTERERLLKEAPCLVEALAFNLPNYTAYEYPSCLFRVGLGMYDLMGRKWAHGTLPHACMLGQVPGLAADGYLQGFRYQDAVLDDARLVFRIIRETVQDGGTALNYAAAEDLLRDRNGKVCGVTLRDKASAQGTIVEVKAKAVINAAGPWCDDIRTNLKAPARLRPLRGSHIILSAQRLPVSEAVTFFHPKDKRAMFIIPWEGTTLIGTTDIDHSAGTHPACAEPFASSPEIDYILEGIAFLFPRSAISHADILSTFAGLRPVIHSGAAAPSKASRAHQVWEEDGLITISGGKLTTFRIMARDALALTSQVSSLRIKIDQRMPMLKPVCNSSQVQKMDAVERRLIGRSGGEGSMIMEQLSAAERAPISGLPAIWGELKFAAAAEAALHLDDLLLRRTRIGMLLPQGARALLPEIRKMVQQEIGWSDTIWNNEETRYLQIWENYYSPQPGGAK